MKTATFIKQMEDFRGDARLYKLSEAAPFNEGKTTKYVIVSAVNALPSFLDDGGPETYIFPADEEGNVASWREMDGSLKGDLDHARALSGLGLVIE